MSTNSEPSASRDHRLDRVQALLSEPLLLPGEDRAEYNDLLTAITVAVQPTDVIEQIWTSEAVEKAWVALRQRRFKAAKIAANRRQALATILHPLLCYFTDTGDHEAQILAREFTLGDTAAINKVDDLLKKAHLTMAAVDAQAMAMDIDTFETFDRQVWAAETRRDALLDLIERRRAALGRKPRRTLAELEQSEISKLERPAEQNNIAAAQQPPA